MKAKTSVLLIAIGVLLLGAAVIVVVVREDVDRMTRASRDESSPGSASRSPRMEAVGSAAAEVVRDPLPGQGRATIEAIAAGGVVSGRVINAWTGDGVAGAELTFTSARDGGATTVRSGAAGMFELAPAASGSFTLAAASAPGFLPYAPELLHSTVRVEVAAERAVRGITVLLFPAVDYHGRVVDERGAAVAGARVRLLGTPAGEQAIDKLETEWVSDRDGKFLFHAADDAVLEAVKGTARGWARLDGDVAITKQLVIAIGAAPARDATIAGRVVDEADKPIADVLVRARPEDLVRKPRDDRATAFATTGADGGFVLEGLDRGSYELEAQAEARAAATRGGIAGGSRDVVLTLEAGEPLAGVVKNGAGEVVPAYTLLVTRRNGTLRELSVARSIVDATGRFEVRVPRGEYVLVAAASGWAPSAPVSANAGDRDIQLVVSAGATLRGRVVADDSGGGIPYARILREALGGGASAQPANAGTVTRADGSFELTGLPPGRVSITVTAGGYHPRIEAGLDAIDGGSLGPVVIRLTRLGDGETPSLELVGIGVQLSADASDTLEVQRVFPDSGAAAAGIVAGDRVLAIDGVAVTQLGMEGAVGKIRGLAGTTLAVTLVRDDQPVTVVVTRKKLRA